MDELFKELLFRQQILLPVSWGILALPALKLKQRWR